MSKTLYLIRGHSGSGKSTLAGILYDNLSECSMFEADQYFLKFNPDTQTLEYKFDASKLQEAHERCQNNVLEIMQDTEDGYDTNIVVANTFTRIWEMQPYLDMAKKYDWTVVVIRCENNFKNIHGVPEDVVLKQKARFESYCE